VQLTAGVERLDWGLAFRMAVARQQFTLSGDGGDQAQVETRSATASLELQAGATSVPVELTSGVRLLSVLGIYGGVGASLQVGDSTVVATHKGDLYGTMPGSDESVRIGTATVTLDGTAHPRSVEYHGIAGVALHLWRVDAFVQATAVPYVGAAVGAGVRALL
jgi:hypothetical protein